MMERSAAEFDVQGHVQRAKERQAWFEGLVRSQERFANENPVAYQRRVRWFGLVSYAYIFGILALVLAFLTGVLWLMFFTRGAKAAEFKLLIVGGIIAAAILRALWVKFDPPEGLLVTADDAPRLHEEVRVIAQTLGAPAPQEIRINSDLNAAAEQYPRLGVFGWYKDVLHLGMPLLLSLSPGEARSVIAHELGHFSGQHGRFGSWAYRLNRTWEQLYDNLERHGGTGAWLFRSFVGWFSPRFAALTFALRRANEYEADRAAATIAGAETASRALMRLPSLGSQLQKSFWEPLYGLAKTHPHPPKNALASLQDVARRHGDTPDVKRQLELALAEKTGYSDTHPCLSDRLSALKQMPKADIAVLAESLSSPLEVSAAEEFFGPKLPQVIAQLEERFSSEVREGWAEAHAQYARYREELAKLEGAAKDRELTEKESVDRAMFIYHLDGDAPAEPHLRAVHERFPGNGIAVYYLGQILLEREDAEGLALMEQVPRLEPRLADDARRAAAHYYYKQGQHDKVEALKEEAFEAYAKEELAETAAYDVRITDEFLPPDYDEEERRDLVAQLAKFPKLDRAYGVRKQLPATGETRSYLFVFHVKSLIESGDEPTELIDAVTQGVTFRRETLVYSDPKRKPWLERLGSIPGALLHERKA